MKKLFLLLLLFFFSNQGFAASCPDGSEPTRSVSADGSYFQYKCNADEKLLRDSRNTWYQPGSYPTWYQPGSYPGSMQQFIKDRKIITTEPQNDHSYLGSGGKV